MDVIGVYSPFVLGNGAGRCGLRVDLGQFLDDGSTYSFVMRGLDPRIHSIFKKNFHEADGLPGQARQ
jgi:hypothetical protein